MALRHQKPPASLLRELEEVAEAARELQQAVQASNNLLPETFPQGALLDICTALAALPDGTAEGCRVPLEYARLRLPAIRREHLGQEDVLPTETDLDRPPPLLRGMGFDRQLRDLISSVTTALDEYRSLASEPRDDRVQAEPAIESAGEPIIPAVIKRSIAVEEGLGQRAEAIAGMANPGSVQADHLSRRMRDAAGLTRMARAELRMPRVVIRWYRALTAALADYPTLIRKAAEGIDVTIDITQPLRRRWNNFWSNAETFLFSEFGELADTLREIAERLERRRGGGQTKSGSITQEKAEFRARELILAGEPVPSGIARLVRRLDLSGTMQAFTKLPRPELLKTLPRLQELAWFWAETNDLSPIADLKDLTSLSLSADNVGDLSPIADLKDLTSLSLHVRNAQDLSPIADLKDLTSLSLSADNVDDLSPIAGLKDLTSLSLHVRNAQDLSPISNLRDLTSLQLSARSARDLSPIAHLVRLFWLTLRADSAHDLSPLASLTSLTSLRLHAVGADNLLPLAALVDLEELQLLSLGKRRRNPAIDDADHLASSGRAAIDLSPLRELHKLRVLEVGDVVVADWTPVAHVERIKRD